MQDASDRNGNHNESAQPLDPLAYAQSITAGILHPNLSDEQRKLNYSYLRRWNVDFPGLEPIYKEIENTWLENETLPSMGYIRTKCSQFEDFLAGALARYGEMGKLPDRFDYERLVDDYVSEWHKRNTRSILAHASDLAGEDPKGAINYVMENYHGVERDFVSMSGFSMRDNYETTFARTKVFPAHLRPLDGCIGNFRLGHTAVLGAFRGHLKTTMATNIFYNAVIRYGFHCCFISLEMSREDIYIRLLILHAQQPQFEDRGRSITLSKVKQGMLTGDEKQFLFGEVEADFQDRTRGKMEILGSQEFPELSMREMQFRLKQVKAQLQGHLHAVFVDYIQMLARIGSSEGKFARNLFDLTSIWARSFQQMAKTFSREGIFVLLLAQTSNEAFKDAEKAGGAYQEGRVIGESKEIEDAADYVITLYCGEEEKKNATLMIQVTKNRFGTSLYTPAQLAIDLGRGIVQDWERSENLDAYTVDIM